MTAWRPSLGDGGIMTASRLSLGDLISENVTLTHTPHDSI